MSRNQPAWLKLLTEQLGAELVSWSDEDRMHYGRDWTKFFTPNPTAIVFPKTTDQIVQIVQFANQHSIAIVPSGGRTGLSGGAVATNGELVLVMDRMNKILDFDSIDQTVRCQAGVITKQLQQFAEEKQLMYPVDFASSGSSQLGGNIATNAGGIKVIRYGLTRRWVAGLSVVTGKGELLHFNHGLVKNATGYDLRHLFIGSEGTLGIIVEATMQLCKPPNDHSVLLLGLPDMAAVMQVFSLFRDQFDLSA
ncbi:MAG: FAD-binding oxidoreductase, partial [Pseudomonadota bacterium]